MLLLWDGLLWTQLVLFRYRIYNYMCSTKY